ncbi:type II toxin-antitoxin system RelE/ParE family toxin [Sphingomonas sp. PB4P5]|uniref:type II toxin-antitoxin system RelE/ParE family toxin n=1 Tax=Parasphingomonas puruogangriensis TaxID=3096155 RepID=UPI002FC94776
MPNDKIDGKVAVLYEGQRYSIEQTSVFADWLNNLRDRAGRARILARVRRLADGNSGDAKSVGDGVFELRIFVGPGYRAYFTYRDNVVVLLLTGGDKDSQVKDIDKAKLLTDRIGDDTGNQTI